MFEAEPSTAPIALDPHQLQFTELTVEPAIPDSERDKYATGRGLLSLLRLREPYFRLLRKYHDRYVAHAEAIAQERVPNDPHVAKHMRESLLRIGGYQIWAEVYRDELITRRLISIALIATCIGSTITPATYYSGHSFWFAMWYVLAVAATAAIVELVAFVATGLRDPSPSSLRSTVGILVMIAIIVGWSLLRGWPMFWGRALSSGIAVAVATWILLALITLAAQWAVSSTYQHSHVQWTAEEIIECLVWTSWELRQQNAPSYQDTAAVRLEHIAKCVRHHLPRYLARSPLASSRPLLSGAQSRFDEMSAAVCNLALDQLAPSPTTQMSTLDELTRLIAAAAQGYWGDWKRAPVDDDWRERSRPWQSRGKELLVVLPLVTMIAVAIYFSSQLPPKEAAAIIVGTFTTLIPLLTPRNAKKAT